MLLKQIVYINITLIVFFLLHGSCKSTANLSAIDELDIDRYMGTWYEIARLPNDYEQNMKCVTATYSMDEDGDIKVLNRGFNVPKNVYNTAKGTIWVADKEHPAQLKVSFFWPFSGDYYIIDLDRDYNYALVGEPTRKNLWILSREASLESDRYDKLIKIAKNKGFATENLIKVEHDCQ